MAEPRKQPHPRTVFTDPVHFLAFGFGAGLAPVAPGTWGTGVGVAVALLWAPLPLVVRGAAVAVMFGFGIWLCGESARRLGEHDHPGIVWDEIVGFLAMMLVAPTGWSWIAAGFVLFRVFDIFKPWPIRDLDHRIRGGLGIMLDDMLAAAYAAVGLFALQLFLNAWSA